MSSVNSINNLAYLEKLRASQAGGGTPEAGTANNAFAELFQSILDASAPAQSTAANPATASGGDALAPALAGGNLSAAQLAFESLRPDAARKAHPHLQADEAAVARTAIPADAAVPAVAPATPSDLLNLLQGS